MVIKKSHFFNVIAAIMLIAFLGIRPMLLGQVNTLYASIFTLGFVLLLSLIYKFKRNIQLDIFFYGSLILFWFLILILGTLGSSNIEFLIKAFLANTILVVSVCYFFLSNKELLIKVINSFIYLLAFLGISSVISSSLFLFGMSLDSLLIFEIETGYPRPSKVIFPFSILYHEMTAGGVQILRYQSIFRESGISQAFYIWSIVISIYMSKDKWIILSLFCGLATTFSTASIALSLLIIPIALFTNHSFKKTNIQTITLVYFFTIFVVPILFYLAYYYTFELPYIGVNSKLLTHSTSINDRLPNVEEITFLGSGIYSSDVQNSAINLLKGSKSLGLMLTLFYIYFYTLMCWFGTPKGDGIKIFVCLLPLFLTSLISQPLVDAPFLYLLLYVTRATPWKLESITNEY